MIKKRLIEHLRMFAEQQGWTWHLYGDGWITEFEKGSRRFVMYGYSFPLNGSSYAGLAQDKAGASQALAYHGVPCVPHALIFNDEVGSEWYGLTGDILTQQLDVVIARFGFPLVLKPNLGMGGNGVVLVNTREEALRYLQEVLQHERDYAVCAFVPDAQELRVLLLDGEPLCCFEKQRQAQDWRHNLAHGALAVPVTDAVLEAGCIALAQQGCTALGLRLASVDVFVTAEGLQIIEVNSGITLEKMAEHLPNGLQLAQRAYESIFLKCTAQSDAGEASS